MATIYSLICFGGRTGKIVSISVANPCEMSLSNNGLRTGFGVVFSTSGSLPPGVTSGVTYYVKSNGAHTAHLYDTSANAIAGGTTGRVTTTGSQSGTHTIKSAYRNALTTDQLLRYGTAGSERIYDSVDAFNTGRAGASPFDTEICEISDAFTTTDNYSLVLNVPCASLKLTTLVNGVRSQAFHRGYMGTTTLNDGFIFKYGQTSGDAIRLSRYYQELDGFAIHCVSAGNTNAVNVAKSSTFTRRMKLIGTGGTSTGIAHAGVLNRVERNIVIGFNTGLMLQQYADGSLFANNIFAKNTAFGVDTIYGTASAIYGFFYNNISVGNGTNWRTPMSSNIEGADKNAGLSGEAWIKDAGTRLTVATTDFIDYANNDFRPALSTSPQVNTGTEYYQPILSDAADNVVPNYINGTTDKFDVGALEFDHGNGLKPISSVTTFKGVKAGSEIRIYNSARTELAGVENCSADHELSWTIPVGDVDVVIIHPQYKIKEFSFTSTEGANSLPIQQDVDKWFSNPA